MENIVVKTKTINPILRQGQKLLLNSLLYAGLGFIIVSGLSLLVSWILRNQINVLINDTYIIVSSILSFVFIITFIVLNSKWAINFLNASFTFIAISWIMNIIFFTIIIAPLITMIDNFYLVYIVLSISGVMFIGAGITGTIFINLKHAVAINNLIAILIGIIFIGQLVFILLFGFLYTNKLDVIYMICDIIYLIVSVLCIAITFWQIKQGEEFYKKLNNTQKQKANLFFGMKILTCFIYLLMTLLRLIIDWWN